MLYGKRDARRGKVSIGADFSTVPLKTRATLAEAYATIPMRVWSYDIAAKTLAPILLVSR
jgi:hypothetical protein